MNKRKKNGPEQMTKHHRVPRSMGGASTDDNISIVKRKHHEAYHLLFLNGSPEDIARYLNEVWIDPKLELIVKIREGPITHTGFKDY